MRTFRYYIIIFFVMLVACQDNMNIKDLQAKNKLVVYCLPTINDTIKIYISPSIPITGSKESSDSAYISFTNNGIPETVHFLKRIDDNQLYKNVYYVVGTHNIGSDISLKVVAKKFPEVRAITTIPTIPEIQSLFVDTIFSSGKPCTQIKLKIKSRQIKAYFAVKVIGKESRYNKDKDSMVYHLQTQEIDIHNEPILNNFTKGETAINTDNNFYHNFYVFDNTTFAKDSTYTLHLCIPNKSYISKYKVQLYHITPEFYHFIKSINDTNNNELGNYGISFVQPGYSNIINGIGIVGGYSMKETKWIPE